MLVLSRKLGERIVLGPEIELTVVAIHGGRVQLGVCAPREVPIHRIEHGGLPHPDLESVRTNRSACEGLR